jgi:mono/diheme cytochrome c family protein
MSAASNRSGQRRRGFPLGALIAGVIIGVLITGGFIGWLAVGLLPRRSDLPFERTLAAFAKDAAIPRAAAAVTPPAPLDDRRALARGREAYNGSCAVCHGADGSGQGRFGAVMYPPASDLRTADVQGRSDGQLFWIVQNGLSFVGMPAFGSQYSDEMVWSLVGYMRALGRGDAPPGSATPLPTDEDLALGHPFAPEADRRGAAIFYEQGCYMCHGPRGNAVGNMALRPTKRGLASADTFNKTLREPPAGMPTFGTNQVDERDVTDLYAYIQSVFPRAG